MREVTEADFGNAFAELILLERLTPEQYVDKVNAKLNAEKEDEDALETS